jgi:outer membrane protein OmpA-like peptidoglycan-associated protein
MRYLLFILFIPIGIFAQTKKIELFFQLNVSTLDTKSIQQLDKLKSQSGMMQIKSVTAYTDPSGTDSINIPLAESRRNVVVSYLQNAGLKVETSSAPASIYPSNAAKLKNHAYWRRVDIVYEIASEKKTLEFNGIKLNENQKDLQPIPLTIEFENASDYVKVYSLPELDKLFQFLNTNQNVDIFIRGHVCCMDDYEISFLRAKAVNDYLIRRGISENRLGYEGYSNTIPLVTPELTEEDQQRNRRVDVIFTIK